MIADDMHLVMGSANVNDRSMNGSRDSELAVYIKGNPDTIITVEGNKFEVNRQLHEFRSHIFMEHFGLSREDVQFPSSAYFWRQVQNIVRMNTQIYDIIFKMYPSNLYLNWKKLAERRKDTDMNAFKDLSPHIRGHAVEYPYKFLIEESLENTNLKVGFVNLIPERLLY